jgi:hypothetical protein
VRRLLVLLAITACACTSSAFAASLNVGSWHLWTGSQTLTKASCTVTGTSSTTDTYVNESSPTGSFGSSASLSLLPDAYSSAKWGFVRFSLAGCSIPSTGGADSAQLVLTLTGAPAATRTLTITPVLSSWSGTLTWTQAQSLTYGAPTTTVATGTTNGATLTATVTVDVDALVRNGSANFGWRISDTGAQGQNSTKDTMTVAASEASSGAPQLVVNYEK